MITRQKGVFPPRATQGAERCITVPHGVVVTPLDGGYELTVSKCPLPQVASWVRLETLSEGGITLIPPELPIGGALLERLGDGSFRSSGSSPLIGDIVYAGRCSDLKRAPATTLQFRLMPVRVLSGSYFSFQARLIWTRQDGTEVLDTTFEYNPTTPQVRQSALDIDWLPTDVMSVRIGHYYGTTSVEWFLEVWSGGLEKA